MFKLFSLIGLLLYFTMLLLVVVKEKKNHTIEDFFFAGRTLPFWALSITFIASWWGAASALSTADLAYSDGLGAFWYYGVPVLISTFLMILGAKAIRRVGYLTQGQMMSSRYNSLVARLLAVMILIFMIFSAASQMVGIGDFLGNYFEIKYEYAVLAGTLIVLIYSMFGGFRGVVLTDIIQFVLLLISAVAVFAVALYYCGGFEAIANTAHERQLHDYTNLASGASKYYMYVVTFGCSWMIQANVWQRISAAKNVTDAQKMATMSFFAYIPLYLIVVLTGMAGLALFKELPQGGVVIKVVTDYMSPLLGAVVFVGISAAIMSTMDSLINTGAMTMVLDLSKNSQHNSAKQIRFSQIATLIVSGLALLISLRIRSILDVAWLASEVLTTGAFVPLVMGFIWRRGNSMGALWAMVLGMSFSFYNLLIFLDINLPSFWQPQSGLQMLLGVGISFTTYILVSLFTKPEYEKADNFIKLAALFQRH